ncbi:hypothetical protein [Paracoccus sp. ME4]|uniref:hypothetical protein n=1 Tax=Paracoccus sp. ME4 TaxID=3138066 RepID=UPI00398A8BE3
MTTIILRDRSDLFSIPTFAALNRDSEDQPCVWSNQYHCEDDDNSWSDDWSCGCDDECSECGRDVPPEQQTWIGPEDRLSRAIWETLPERGMSEEPVEIRLEVEGNVIRLAEGQAVLGTGEAAIVVSSGPWPAADDLMREKFPDLAAGARVYLMDGGIPDRSWMRLTAAVIEDRNIVQSTRKTIKLEKDEYRAFCEAWEAKNGTDHHPVIALEPEPDAPGF